MLGVEMARKSAVDWDALHTDVMDALIGKLGHAVCLLEKVVEYVCGDFGDAEDWRVVIERHFAFSLIGIKLTT